MFYLISEIHEVNMMCESQLEKWTHRELNAGLLGASEVFYH